MMRAELWGEADQWRIKHVQLKVTDPWSIHIFVSGSFSDSGNDKCTGFACIQRTFFSTHWVPESNVLPMTRAEEQETTAASVLAVNRSFGIKTETALSVSFKYSS